MFAHIFVYRLKFSLRDRQMLFWTFLFPLLLATFFGMAFSNINRSESFSTFPAAVVYNEAYRADPDLRQALQSVSDPAVENKLFHLSEMPPEQASQALADGSIIGYFLPGETLAIVVADSGIRQTIMKIFADEFLQRSATIQSIAELNPGALATLEQRLSLRLDLLRSEQAGRGGLNNVVIFFYALIGMTCMYGGFYGLREIMAVQANLSGQAARINLVPVHKIKIFAASLSAAFCVHYCSVLLLIAYLIFVQQIDFGSQIGLILLTCLTGSLLGIMTGALIGAIGKAGEGVKNAVLIGITMIFSFFAGLMQPVIKYEISNRFPLLQWINPANLICDSLYALYFYENLNRYLTNTLIQVIMIFVLFGAVYIILRRQRYASI